MKNIEMLLEHPAFENLSINDIEKIVHCFSFNFKEYKRNEYIMLEGDDVQAIGIILIGTVLMEKNDFHGNNYFLIELKEGEIFGDPFMGHMIQSSSVNYKAMTSCTILFFNYRDMWRPCKDACSCHMIFAENLMDLLALKSRALLSKIEILSKKSLRDRILTFLYMIKKDSNIPGFHNGLTPINMKENDIFIPLSHREMAEYLCVNRSALVRELSRMEKAHIIKCEKHIISVTVDLNDYFSS